MRWKEIEDGIELPLDTELFVCDAINQQLGIATFDGDVFVTALYGPGCPDFNPTHFIEVTLPSFKRYTNKISKE